MLCLAPLTHAKEEATDWHFVHNGHEAPGDHRYDYHWVVLAAALEATKAQYGGYSLTSVDFMSEARQISELKSDHGQINTMVLDSTAALERDLQPVKIPVDKGLLGYRVFLIRAQDQARFSAVNSLSDLRQFSIGQGYDWSDVAMYQNAGIKVVGSATYEGLFDMLAAGRFDALGRGVTEVLQEQESHLARLPTLVIEQKTLLYYPMPVYFWFPKTALGTRYAQRVLAGMKIISANGHLDQLFKNQFDSLIQSLHLKDRQLFRIANPNLPADQPFKVSAYWFDPLR